MEIIKGGITAPQGFFANGIHCGIRKNKTKRDLTLIKSECRASAACVYTQNLVKGAPIYVTKKNVENGYAAAIICNSGNANTCNANGIEIAQKMCALVEKHAKIASDDIIVASTGVIGQPLSIEPIEAGMEELVAGLGSDEEHGVFAAEGIMTTDTRRKEIAVSFSAGGKTCKIGGICKGSGMIHPNMATMLVFITTDISISPEMLQKALSDDVTHTFNMISIDGDTSTNDMVSVLANGMAGNPRIDTDGSDFEAFRDALKTVTTYLCRAIAKDGEGATKLLECAVRHAKTEEAARAAAKSVINSSLFKSAMFGSDANWGRVLCAIGYCGEDIDVAKIDVSFISAKGAVNVCRGGYGVDFSEEAAKEILSCDEVIIDIDFNDGDAGAVAWGCDLTYDYVKINGDYRT